MDAARDEVQALLRALVAATGSPSWPELRWAAAARIDPRRDRALWELRLNGAASVLAEVSGRLGNAVRVDALELVQQRGLEPQGTTSASGSCRLLPTTDGWVAVSLNRPDDWDLLPALFGTAGTGWDWDAVGEAVATTVAVQLEADAAALGLAVAALPADPGAPDAPWRITMTTHRRRASRTMRVVDLSSLWAGPLCTSLLRRAGAEILTVESTSRPDGARRGDPELHRLLHEGNTFVTLDFGDPADLDELHRLVAEADIVVSGARMRALQHLGLDPFPTVAARPGLTWVGISAYGLTGPDSNRIGYGDDTAVAGGLVDRGPTPAFIADAVADPVTGLYAAIAALAVSASGGGVVDAPLRDAAAHLARPAT